MSDKAQRPYSIARGLAQLYNRGVPPSGLEAECHVELSRNWPYQNAASLPGLKVPFAALAQDRQLSATSPPGGGIEWISGREMVYGADVLLTPSIVRQSGATILPGLRGNTAMPQITGLSAPPEFLPENAEAPLIDLQTAAVLLVPRRLSSSTVISRQLLIQGGVELDFIIRHDLSRTFSSVIDYMALVGRGAAFNEPLGVLNWPGVIDLPIVAADPLYERLVEAEELIELERVSLASFGYITSPELRRRLRNTPKFSAAAAAAGTGDTWESLTNPRSSPQVVEQRAFFGSWENLLIGLWAGGFEIVLDPYSRASTGQVVLTGHLWADVALRHGRAFGFSSVITPFANAEEPVRKKAA